MALQSKPNMEFIWASGGAIVEPSDVKKQTGWTPEVPPHQWENWIQNRQDQYIAHINQRGIPQWDGSTEYEASGLSYVQGSNGVVYKSVAASGPSTVVQNPTTDVTDTYWEVAFSDFLNTTRTNVASAATVNLTTAAPSTRHVSITGTTTITGFTVATGQCYFVSFSGALTLTNNANIVTNTGGNIVTAAGDSCIIRALAANTVEIICGNFLENAAVGGRGQAWVNVTGSRAVGTNYTNTTGRAIMVSFSGSDNSNIATLIVNGIAVARSAVPSSAATEGPFVTGIVPPGAVYRVEGTTFSWVELR